MGVYIKDMEMPKACNVCNYSEWSNLNQCYECYFTKNGRILFLKDMDKGERHKDCPLIEISTPHGRLIDADRIHWDLAENEYGKRNSAVVDCEMLIDNTPTVIEAEERENHE